MSSNKTNIFGASSFMVLSRFQGAFVLITLLILLFSSGLYQANATATQSKKADKQTAEEKPSVIVNDEIEGVKEKISNLLASNKAEVMLDGRFLFELSGNVELTARERADRINSKLNALVEQIQKNNIPPRVRITHRHASTFLTIDGQYLLTVTEADLSLSNKYTSIRELAEFMKDKLESGFSRVIKERSKNYLPKALLKVAIIVLAALIVSLCVLSLVSKTLGGRVVLILFGVWLFALVKILGVFPETREWQYVVERGLLKPLFMLLVIVWLAIMLNRLSYWLIGWYFRQTLPDGWSATNRKLNRALTLKKVAEATSNSVFVILAIMCFLLLIGINLASVITGAGLIGLAVGFIAQDLIKDILNGLAILIEDQFGVGDVIRVGSYAGKVEDFSLRFTKLRNIEGCLINIPNKKIDIVENLTSGFAQVDFRVGVDYSTDLNHALQVMEATATKLAQDWPDKIMQLPEMLGVERLSDWAIELRLILKTLPMEQWAVMRELNLRIKKAFDEANIKIPFPKREIKVSNAT